MHLLQHFRARCNAIEPMLGAVQSSGFSSIRRSIIAFLLAYFWMLFLYTDIESYSVVISKNFNKGALGVATPLF